MRGEVETEKQRSERCRISTSWDGHGKALQIENFRMQIENLSHCSHPGLSGISQDVGVRAVSNRIQTAIDCV